MKKLFLIFMLFYCSQTISLAAMSASETAEAQPRSSLPKILHKIAYSGRIGKFCSWLFKPITQCCKNERLRHWFSSPQKTSPELGDHPLVKLTKVKSGTSKRFTRVKQSVAIISIGLLILFNLPQAGAIFNNLENYLKPTVCVENDAFKRCCTIEDNLHISCCVTDKFLGIEVCKDYLVTMPATAPIPFQDLSRTKNQCSADTTPESQMIRNEFQQKPYHIMLPISQNSGTVLPNFLKKFQQSLTSIGVPVDAPLCIVFPHSGKSDSDVFLDAALYPTPLTNEYYWSGFVSQEYPRGGLATLHLRSNLFEYLSVDEIFATINHELGHLLFKLRQFAKDQLEGFAPQDPKTIDYKKHNEEMFADLTSGLLSTKDSDQTSFLRQYATLQNSNTKNKILQESLSTDCAIKNFGMHPPLLCRIAFLDNIQDQLDYENEL